MVQVCTLCPRNCNVDRTAEKRGYCGESNTLRISRAALHMWEEPCISGSQGSGAVFFSGCNLRCVFCQNFQIANGSIGKEITVERLSQIFLELQDKKAANINLVTGSHFVPQIIEALRIAKSKGLVLPIVYNTSGYETMENIKRLQGFVDIYLPDMKYCDRMIAKAFSNAPDYFEVAGKAINEMVSQVGTPIFDENGMMKKGVIVRHLILPAHTKDSCSIIQYLHDTYGDNIYLSIMNQYTPLREIVQYPELNRRVTGREYEKVINYTLELGIEHAFIQEGNTAKESFIPAFDYDGV